ncbi:hypothetical protein P7F88_11070 [Vibrio hannami]|nr:hypothetical protein [Vibrio hannami]MDG3086623.1 hypothetical protein [Vibrio hannami]
MSKRDEDEVLISDRSFRIMQICLSWMSRLRDWTLLSDLNFSMFCKHCLKTKTNRFSFLTHITSDLEKVADYITLINNGQLVLSKTKDELLEEYCIVKGSHDTLHAGGEGILIGLKKNRFGFEGLSRHKREVVQQFGGFGDD